jgi:xyloglucan-specific endo-beta-1,4-glucanase
MRVALIVLFQCALALALAKRAVHRRKQDTSAYCGQWDSITATSRYSLLVNQWGLADASAGSSCAQVISVSGDAVAWMTNWTWSGGMEVKSFTNVQLNEGIHTRLSAINSIPVRVYTRRRNRH